MPIWSPDSKKIAYLDAHLNTWYVDVEAQKPVKVDKDRFLFAPGQRVPAWSPDSKWIAYSKRLPNYLSTIFVYSLADGKSRQLTDGLSDARYPVFDKDGKHLYFTASTDSGPSLEPDIRSASRHGDAQHLRRGALEDRSVAVCARERRGARRQARRGQDRRQPTRRSPRPPAEEPAKPTAPPGAPRVPDVTIDFDKISQRILAMPMPARSYTGLQVAKAGTLLALEAPAPGSGVTGTTVHRYDLRQRRGDVLVSGVRFFEVSANGEKILTAQENRWTIQNVRPLPPAGGSPAASSASRPAVPVHSRCAPTTSKSGRIPRSSGSRCITTRGGSSASSSTIRTSTASTSRPRSSATSRTSPRSSRAAT